MVYWVSLPSHPPPPKNCVALVSRARMQQVGFLCVWQGGKIGYFLVGLFFLGSNCKPAIDFDVQLHLRLSTYIFSSLSLTRKKMTPC